MAFFPPGEMRARADVPETYYIVVSLAAEPPVVRAFFVRTGGRVDEEPVEVVDG